MGQECRKCGLHRYRRHVLPSTGATPADVLFIGDAPNKSEDLSGKPFIGPSARLLDLVIERAALVAEVLIPSVHFINLTRCRACNGRQEPDRAPTKEEVWACWPNLSGVVDQVRPQQIIFLGKVATQFCKPVWKNGRSTYHPSYIVTNGGSSSSQFREMVRVLAEMFEEMKQCQEPKRKLFRKGSSSSKGRSLKRKHPIQ